MVLMYHDIGHYEAEWVRKWNRFRDDLNALYHQGYRPVSLRDFVTDTISTAKGMTPVVITFDDGTKGQFKLEEKRDDKHIDPKSAVGILEEFHAEHPDFPLEATFFLHGRNPFWQPTLIEYKLNYLVKNGFDIGNHTTEHQNLSQRTMQDPLKIQRAIGKQRTYLKKMLSSYPDYPIDTLALCYGARPRSKRLSELLAAGTYRGETYHNIAVLNVGAGPSRAPSDRRFNPLAIPRIRVSDIATGVKSLQGWLDYYNTHPEERYISDGNPVTITIREQDEGNLERTDLNGRSVIVKKP